MGRRGFVFGSVLGGAGAALGAWNFWPRTPPEWKFLYLQEDHPDRYELSNPSAGFVDQFVANQKKYNTLHSVDILRGGDPEYHKILQSGWTPLTQKMEQEGIKQGTVLTNVSKSYFVSPEAVEQTEHARNYAERALDFTYTRYPEFHPFTIPFIGINDKKDGIAMNEAYLGRYMWQVTELTGSTRQEPERSASVWRVKHRQGASVTLGRGHSRENPLFAIFLPVRDVLSFAVFSETIPLNTSFSEDDYEKALRTQGRPPAEARDMCMKAAEGLHEGLANYLLQHFGKTLGIPEPERWAKEHKTTATHDAYVQLRPSLDFITRVGDREAVKIAMDDLGEYVRRVHA